ncbi:hypothetical protein AAES_142058 [Amazona aestiva]|uniref:Uncharacterized protein n=1 Tax=Amazona aestiva TaxID=12930 RepID=A0A0Q3LZR8_AMAAE|nr:hypothetical protein AAES_142058 [Amazona aestiva]
MSKLISIAEDECRERLLQLDVLDSCAAVKEKESPVPFLALMPPWERSCPIPKEEEMLYEELGHVAADPSTAARAQMAHLAGLSTLQKGRPAAHRPLQPTRGHASGNSRVPQEPMKLGSGQQAGAFTGPQWDSKALANNLIIKEENKTVGTAESVASSQRIYQCESVDPASQNASGEPFRQLNQDTLKVKFTNEVTVIAKFSQNENNCIAVADLERHKRKPEYENKQYTQALSFNIFI